MADTRTAEQRRKIMQAVQGKDTGPEWVVRRLLHGEGYRYRLHDRRLPGRPDIVFPGRRKTIFVHGCFWHGHDCAKGRLPKTRLDYWAPKIEANRERDARKRADLEALGWTVCVIWQCEIKEIEALKQRLWTFLEQGQNAIDIPARMR